MRYQIVLHRNHALTDPAAKPTQMAIRSCNDIAMSKRLNVYVKVITAQRAASADDSATIWADGQWHELGRFIDSTIIPAHIKKLYRIIRDIEEAYGGI